jgi:hypothetical protein
MVDADRDHLTAQNQTEQIARTVRALYDRMSKWEDSIYKSLAGPRLEPGQDHLGVGRIPGLQSGDQWGLGLIHIWTASDIKWPWLRIMIYLMFRVGLVLVAIPAAVTFGQVIMLTWR